MSTNQEICRNCEQPYEKGFKFCPHCGQKIDDDLTIGVLFYNTISNYFSFDARFLKSFLPLMFRPGYLASKFLEGKRLLYLHPAQMYLFISVIFFFIISFSTRDLVSKANEINQKVVDADAVTIEKDSAKQVLDSTQIDKVMKPIEQNKELLGIDNENFKLTDSIIKANAKATSTDNITWDFDKKKVDSLIAVGADENIILKEMGMSDNPGFFERRIFENALKLTKGRGAGGIVQAFFDSIPISMFFLLPLFALILKIFYFNKGKYAHHLVFSFYFFSYLFTVFSILFAVNRFIHDIPDWIDWLVALSTYFYFLIALIKFYKQNWFLSWIKSGIISFTFLLFVLPMSFSILAFVAFVMN
ncbi:DUF3667 domain-containing protein [Winogradskyella sp.]|uniref:DUF3667 domain-containing protein n=1 Tax=Winogradskyella sp. TaxID=1883156 RepID=UPI002609AB6F|nr:DUF3667 domain-containing protein [Winogradskyella sp.]